METWESQTVRKGASFLRITALPAKHAPQPLATLLPTVNGNLLEFGRDDRVAYRLYQTGDTLLFDRLAEIAQRHPDIDLALLHLGGTRIAGALLTMNGEQGVRALELTRPHETIPVHYNDYTVMKSPLSDFQRAVDARPPSTRIHCLAHGETYEFTVPQG